MKASLIVPWVLVLFLSSCSHSPPFVNRANGLTLIHAQIVDPDAERIFEGAVIVHHGKVEQVLTLPPSEAQLKAFPGEVIDRKDLWLVPALADLHTHSWGNPAPNGQSEMMMTLDEITRMDAQVGVTTVLDLASKDDRVFPFRDQQRRAQSPNGIQTAALGADFFCAGPVFAFGMSPESSAGLRVIRSPEQAILEVSRLVREWNPDVIKILYGSTGDMPTIRVPTLRAAIRSAHEFHKKVVVHIGNWKQAERAVLAGADAITHLHELSPIPEHLAQAMAKRQVVSIPTMAVQSDMRLFSLHPEWTQDPLLKEVASTPLLQSYLTKAAYTEEALDWVEWQTRAQPNYRKSLQVLDAHHVQILAGSDTGNLGTFQGFSAHREIEILAQNGIPVWTALKAGTTSAHRWLGKEVSFHPGAVADFVLLRANPIINLENARQIERVMVHGQWVSGAALDK